MRNEYDLLLTDDGKLVHKVVRELGVITYEQIKSILKYISDLKDYNYDAFTDGIVFDLIRAKAIFTHEEEEKTYTVIPKLDYSQAKVDAFWVMLAQGFDRKCIESIYNADYPAEIGYLKGITNYEIAYIPSGSYAPIVNLCEKYTALFTEEGQKEDLLKYILIFEEPDMARNINNYIKKIPFKYLPVSVSYDSDIPTVERIK